MTTAYRQAHTRSRRKYATTRSIICRISEACPSTQIRTDRAAKSFIASANTRTTVCPIIHTNDRDVMPPLRTIVTLAVVLVLR